MNLDWKYVTYHRLYQLRVPRGSLFYCQLYLLVLNGPALTNSRQMAFRPQAAFIG